MSLVEELRRMTAASTNEYKVGTTAYWSEDHLQAVLDKRVTMRLLQAPIEVITITEFGGAVVAKNGRVEIVGTLDTETAEIVGLDGGPIEGDATVFPNGAIDFTENQLSASPRISGLAYDLNGAAADVLTDWAASVKGGYDVTIDGQALRRSQRHAQLLAQAEAFRSKAVIGSVRLTRSDTRRRRCPT
jgi:hypothetical protein